MSGRKPIPTKLKLLRGNPGKRPLPENEPQPQVRLPSAPTFLSEEGKREWKRTGRRLQSLGLMTEIDTSALAAYCQAWARWKEAEEMLNQFGAVIKVGGSLQPSPYLSVANKAMAQMVKLLAEFGMTPSSRSRVTAVATEKAEDPMDALRRMNANHNQRA
jgi:P27 family predicted phage terminase small subunit